MIDYYALYDKQELITDQDRQFKKEGCFKIPFEEAQFWNDRGFGIFWTVQSFKGNRTKEYLDKIIRWAIDIDCKGKKEELIPLFTKWCYPSLIIETKNGFHLYWNAKDATEENFAAIVSDRLVFLFNADKNAKDISRILRVPNFLHLKDPSDPFKIKKIWEYDVSYTEDQMFWFFEIPENKVIESYAKQQIRKEGGSELADKIYAMDCELALTRLSGTPAINWEKYSFKQNLNGNKNIWVDNKSTSCFIDKQKLIGSMDGGGPTIWQWINWYHRDHKKTYSIIREYFPELWKK